MKPWIVSLFCFLLPTGLWAQQLQYNIVWKGDSIGYLNVERFSTDSTILHVFESNSQFRILFLFTTGYSSEVVFKNGLLAKSRTLTYMNDGLRGSADVNWINNQYEIIIDGIPQTLSTPVTNTVGMLYFTEPRQLSRVFSERHGQYLPISDIGDGKYELKKPDNNTNIYTYVNGMCTEVEIHNTWATFYFVLAKKYALD